MNEGEPIDDDLPEMVQGFVIELRGYLERLGIPRESVSVSSSPAGWRVAVKVVSNGRRYGFDYMFSPEELTMDSLKPLPASTRNSAERLARVIIKNEANVETVEESAPSDDEQTLTINLQ